MRIVNAIFCLLMLLFIGVQYNDPDGPMWMVIYSIPAIWAALAAFAPGKISSGIADSLLVACIFAALSAVYYYWPTTPGWWRQEVWWEVETAREGMGMMIVAIVLAAALLGSRLYRSGNQSANAAGGEDLPGGGRHA